MTPLVIGIDLGLKGAVCLIDSTGMAAYAHIMPTMKNPHGGNDVDVVALRRILNSYPKVRIGLTVIEHTHAFGREAPKALFSFGRGTGRVQALLELEGYQYQEVRPTEWKKVVLTGTTRDKAAAIAYCHRRFPDLNPTNHDGIADAFCLAEYARRVLAGGIK